MSEQKAPWQGPFELPTLDRLNSQPDPSISPKSVAQEWLSRFEVALRARDSTGTLKLFLQDAFWRDLLALSWEFRSLIGISAIDRFLEERLPSAELRNFKLLEDDLYAPTLSQPFPDLAFIQLCFKFETASGSGQGLSRLVQTAEGAWKAYTVFTSLTSLRNCPEIPLRDETVYHGKWEEKRAKELEFTDGEPTVVIIGAGHTGLEIAARLKVLGVRTLIIERNALVGDSWRKRYKSLATHDPAYYDQTPFIPFPASWPMHAPAAKVGNWLENFAYTLDLNVWTSSEVKSASWDAQGKRWMLNVRRGETFRDLRVKHLIFATGHGGSKPNVPVVPNRELFAGQVLHSIKYQDAEEYKGKKVLVVGACNSGTDIARDCARFDIDVTLYQRSSTFVMSTAAMRVLLSGLYEKNPTEYADFVNASFPLAVSGQIQRRAFAHLANVVDKDILEGLARAGFRTNLGVEDSGILMTYYSRGGGYFIDTGVSQDIIDGKIKLKTGTAIESFTPTGLRFADGTELAADTIVFATGYGDTRDAVEEVCGSEVRNALKPVWGLDGEGELRSVWRPSGHENLWIAHGNFPISRYYSSFLALQIKAKELGLVASA